MSYNRTVAKARAVRRVQDAKSLVQAPNIHGWGALPPPYTPKCRHCGSKANGNPGSLCPTCWRPL